jgi:hypothetical protein
MDVKTEDTDCTVRLKGLDITGLKPYFQRSGDVNVTHGFLDLEAKIKIASRKIKAPAWAVLKDLTFERGTGAGSTFLSIPLSAVTTLLKNSNNEIGVDFSIEGNLDNPQFNLRENLVKKITFSLAEKLGLPVKKIGESTAVLGAQGLKKVKKNVITFRESVRKIFKK